MNKVKYIYKVSTSKLGGYDSWDSIIVIAEDEVQARNTHPRDLASNRIHSYKENINYFTRGWNLPENLIVEKIGIANKNQQCGTILASFNAG